MTTPDDPVWTVEQIDALRNELPAYVPVIGGIDPDVSQDPDLYGTVTALLAGVLPAMGTKARMIYAARSLLGIVEHPAGSNHCAVCDWYNLHIAHIGDGPWCDMGVTEEAHESGNAVAVCGGPGRGFALTTAHARDFQRRGLWHWGAAGIDDGDVAFFSWSRGRTIGSIDHVELVEHRIDSHRRNTIGCNVGNACRRETRDDTYIVGYGRPPYAKAPAPAAAGADSWFLATP